MGQVADTMHSIKPHYEGTDNIAMILLGEGGSISFDACEIYLTSGLLQHQIFYSRFELLQQS